MGKYVFDLANENDNFDLQKLLSENPMEGQIQLTFQRKPNFFRAGKLGNKLSQTMVARNMSEKKIVAVGARSIRDLYINGKISDVGYLSRLRIDGSHRNGTVLARGYNYLKKLHADQKTQIYLTTIAEDNQVASQTLTSRKAGLPCYRYFGNYCSFAVSLFRRKKQLCEGDIKVVRGSYDLLDSIVKCLNENGSQKQFYPFYSKEDFMENKDILCGFSVKDFFVAIRNNKVIGVMGKWNQRDLKQIYVAGYSGWMKVVRPFFNTVAKIMKISTLPKKGEELASFFVSFIAIDNNDPAVFKLLLREVYNSSVGEEYSYFIVGLHQQDPLLEVFQDYQCIRYDTRLYVVFWEDKAEIFNTLDDRIPYLEAATL